VSTEKSERDKMIADYRALLRFLASHPEVPLGRTELNDYCVSAESDEAGLAELERIAAELGVEVVHRPGFASKVARDFGSVTYRAFYNLRDDMAKHYEEQRWLAEQRALRAAEREAGGSDA